MGENASSKLAEVVKAQACPDATIRSYGDPFVIFLSGLSAASPYVYPPRRLITEVGVYERSFQDNADFIYTPARLSDAFEGLSESHKLEQSLIELLNQRYQLVASNSAGGVYERVPQSDQERMPCQQKGASSVSMHS